MGFLTAVQSVFDNYADFTGRARRSEFWWWQLCQIPLIGILARVSLDAQRLGEAAASWIIPLLMIGFVFAVIIPTMSVTVRRLHDTNRSGWFYLINFLPIIGGFILLGMLIFQGTQGDNRFGPNPKDAVA